MADASPAARFAFLEAGLSYLRDINTGDFGNRPEGAIKKASGPHCDLRLIRWAILGSNQ
jgi:hypothetical protein